MQLLKSVMKEFNEVAKGNISEEDLSRARYYQNDDVCNNNHFVFMPLTEIS